MEPYILKIDDYQYHYLLDRKDVAELLYFFFETGWISHEQHDYVHDFIWILKVEMDKLYPNWQPKDLKRICEELRNGHE